MKCHLLVRLLMNAEEKILKPRSCSSNPVTVCDRQRLLALKLLFHSLRCTMRGFHNAVPKYGVKQVCKAVLMLGWSISSVVPV